MKTIWKFPIRTDDEVCIAMPSGAQILAVQMQGETLCLWALVDPAAPKQVRRFKILGTGQDFPDADSHVHCGTYQTSGGMFVFHLFEYRA